jgi:hypothetical protein
MHGRLASTEITRIVGSGFWIRRRKVCLATGKLRKCHETVSRDVIGHQLAICYLLNQPFFSPKYPWSSIIQTQPTRWPIKDWPTVPSCHWTPKYPCSRIQYSLPDQLLLVDQLRIDQVASCHCTPKYSYSGIFPLDQIRVVDQLRIDQVAISHQTPKYPVAIYSLDQIRVVDQLRIDL